MSFRHNLCLKLTIGVIVVISGLTYRRGERVNMYCFNRCADPFASFAYLLNKRNIAGSTEKTAIEYFIFFFLPFIFFSSFLSFFNSFFLSSFFHYLCLLTERISKCESQPCQNEGTCVEDEQDGFHCICSSKYQGRLCEGKRNVF